VDYSTPALLAADRHLMEQFVVAGPPPAVSKAYADRGHVRLPHPCHMDTSGVHQRFAHLLYWAFGKLRVGTFHEVLPALIKAVPSFGARHPLEAYVACGKGGLFEPGLYHYDVNGHSVCAIDGASVTEGTIVVITAIFERLQWRYRGQAERYRALFHDVGHVCETLHFVAPSLRFRLTPCQHRVVADDWAPLVEEPIASYRVSEIAE
jgi:hypothetical protein